MRWAGIELKKEDIMEPIDIIIIVVAIAVVVGVAAYSIWKKKKGKGGCGCGCSGCSNSACPSKKAAEDENNA